MTHPGEARRQSTARLNLIWERTQASIAIGVTATGLSVAALLALQTGHPSISSAAFVLLSGLSNLVIGFYFGRTNHARQPGGSRSGDVSL